MVPEDVCWADAPRKSADGLLVLALHIAAKIVCLIQTRMYRTACLWKPVDILLINPIRRVNTVLLFSWGVPELRQRSLSGEKSLTPQRIDSGLLTAAG